MHPRTILIVDDDRDVHLICSAALEHHGYAVLSARDGEAGVRIAREHRPDLILMDLRMPRMNGLQATRLLKGDAATAGIPVICVTADVLVPDDLLREGFTALLYKPVEPARILAEVQRIVGPPEG